MRTHDRYRLEPGEQWERPRWLLGSGSPALYFPRLLAHLLILLPALLMVLIIWALMPLLRLKEKWGVRFD